MIDWAEYNDEEWEEEKHCEDPGFNVCVCVCVCVYACYVAVCKCVNIYVCTCIHMYSTIRYNSSMPSSS